MVQWLLAVDLHQIFAIAVLVISVLSWLVNLIQGNNPDGAGRQPKPKSKPMTSRSELEDLIQELTADKRKSNKRPENPPPPPKPRPERTRPAASTTPQRPGSPPPYAPSRASAAPKQPPEQPKRPAANRRESNLGDTIRDHHVSSRVESTVAAAVKADLPSSSSTVFGEALQVPEKQVHPLIKQLREPGGVRQAVILNEILQRPKVLRK